MDRRHFIALAGLAAVASCSRISGSRLNPFNWFGRAERAERVTVQEARVAADPRPLVPRITRLTIDRNPGGAIIRVAGLPAIQGWYGAELVPAPVDDPQVLSFQLRAMPPARVTRASTPQSRELVVATYLTDQDLAGIREIRVTGGGNALAVRR